MSRFGQLFGALRQRAAWQILGSYAVGAWIVLQLAETLAGLIGLPLWFGPAIVTLVLVGFPVILLTSLVQGSRVSATGGAETAPDATPDPDPGDGSTGAPGVDTTTAPGSAPQGEAHGPWGALSGVFTWGNVAVSAVALAVMLGVGTAGYSGMRAAGIGPMGSLMAKGVLAEDERLIVAQFEDRTADGTLGETVTTLLRIALGQSQTLVLLDQTQLQPALQRMQRDPAEPLDAQVALELAQREGIKAVVVGEVLPLGDGAVVVARLVQAGGGEDLVTLQETARQVGDIPDAVDRLSVRLRERIGESLRTIQGHPPLAQVTTASLEALRMYARAEQANDLGDREEAKALLGDALAIDSTFSMAWRKLGVVLQNENEEPDRARDAFTRAFQGRDRLPERERYLADAAYHTYVTDDVEAATHEYERLLDMWPTDRIALNNLAVAYAADGRREEALDLYLRSIRQGGAPSVTYTNAIQALYDSGRPDSAAAVLEDFSATYPGNPGATRFRASFASARFDYATAEREVRRMMEESPGPTWRVFGLSELANYAIVQGRLDEGVEYIFRAFDQQEEIGAAFIPQPLPIFQGMGLGSAALVFLEDPDRAVAELDRGVATLPLPGVEPQDLAHAEYAEVYAQAGRVDKAMERLAAYEAEVPAEIRAEPFRRATELGARAAVAQAEGRADDALALLVEAREATGDCPLCVLPELGEAYEQVGRPDSAVAVFRRYLETPFLHRAGQDNFGLHRVLLGLGRSYEALDRPEEAATYYQRLVELWADADPALQPRVTRVRAKLAELQTG